ncbi:MAG: S8 family serine peptidase [Planctomycetes bacterium]|nr:S8 family serine peptidase [Planctomycetota bacterium]
MNAPRENPAASCPICSERVDRRILEKAGLLENAVVESLRAANPDWSSQEGACPRCVAWALANSDDAAGARSVVPESVGRRGEILSLQSRLRSDTNFSGRGVNVAIVDSDFVYHPEFTKPKNRIITYVDASGAQARADANPPDPYIGSWHGTMVAGAAFGSGSTAGGKFPGIAPEARLVFVKIGDKSLKIGEREVLRGMRWVLNHYSEYQIKVVNLSVGGDEPAPSKENRLDRMAARAVKSGIVVVAAAGNRPGRKPVAPASAPEAITVGGVNDLGGGDADGSWFPGAHGPTLDQLQKPDVLAPAIWVPAPMVQGTPQAAEAEWIYELDALPDAALAREITKQFDRLSLPADIVLRKPDAIRAELFHRAKQQKYITPFHQHVDGTSFASAIVSAVAAQMLEANPDLSPEDIKKILCETARPLRGVEPAMQGAGVVQPADAVRAALELRAGPMPDVPPPEIDGDAIRYFYFDPTGKLTSVEWIGALGGWRPFAFRRVGEGVWMLERPRAAPGNYAYKFLLSDGRWIADPANPNRQPDGFGGWNSVLILRR